MVFPFNRASFCPPDSTSFNNSNNTSNYYPHDNNFNKFVTNNNDTITAASDEFAMFGRIHYVMSDKQANVFTSRYADMQSFVTREASRPPTQAIMLTIEWAARMMISLADMRVMYFQIYPCTATIVEDD